MLFKKRSTKYFLTNSYRANCIISQENQNKLEWSYLYKIGIDSHERWCSKRTDACDLDMGAVRS